MQTLTLHRNPLFRIPGFDLQRLVPDSLHCLYLGVVQAWAVASLWFLINEDVWGYNDPALSVGRIRGELFLWYRRQRRPGITRLQNLTLKMMGTYAAQARQPFKGAESKHLVNFVVELLNRHRLPKGAPLLAAGVAMQRFIYLMDTSALHPPPEVVLEMKRSMVQFLHNALQGGMRPIAKVHQALHMVFDALDFHGNPKYYSNFLDESLNKDLAGIAAKAYSSVWTSRIFICRKRLRESRPRGILVGVDA